MEIRIGIKESARELNFSVENKDTVKNINKALEEKKAPLTLTDTKDNTYVIPIENVAYVVLGSENKPKVGFIS